jgi:polar amino acid transport system substrate-binding protein
VNPELKDMKPRTLLNVLLSCSFAVGLCSTACNAASVQTIESGTLSIGADLNYPPYDYFDAGQPAGFDPTLLTMLSQQMNLTPKFADVRFANLILGIKANRFDLASAGMYVTPERAKQVDFLPYMTAGVSIVVAKTASASPARPEDLCGMRVSSIQGAAWIPKLNSVSAQACRAANKQDIQVVEFPTSAEAAQALLAGAAQAQMEDAAVAAEEVQKSDRLRLSSKELIYPVVVGYAIKKGNASLLEGLQSALQALKKSGQYQKILQQYNVQEPTAEQIKAALGN